MTKNFGITHFPMNHIQTHILIFPFKTIAVTKKEEEDYKKRRNRIKTQEQFPTQKVGNFIYNGVYMYMIIYIYIPLLTKEMSCKKLEILGLMLCLLLLVRN